MSSCVNDVRRLRSVAFPHRHVSINAVHSLNSAASSVRQLRVQATYRVQLLLLWLPPADQHLHRLGQSNDSSRRRTERAELLRLEGVERSPVLRSSKEETQAAVPIPSDQLRGIKGEIGTRRTCSTRQGARRR